jgi:Chalcone isomerase-like
MPRPTHALRLPALALAAALALVAGNAPAATLPAPVANGEVELQRVGAGELRWLGRPIYQASLWTSDGRFQGYGPGETVALSLWYQREFSREELLRITSTAWRLLGSVPVDRRERWLATLAAFWTDVGPGNNVTTVVEPGRATRFYDQRGLMGQVDDPEFGPAFLSIWLDPRSVVGDLRVQLLGSGAADVRR